MGLVVVLVVDVVPVNSMCCLGEWTNAAPLFTAAIVRNKVMRVIKAAAGRWDILRFIFERGRRQLRSLDC